jgi:hypothetical protein
MVRQQAIIVDRDGTAASCFLRPDDRSKSSWEAFNAALVFDAPVPGVVDGLRFLRLLFPHVAIIMTSGRAEGDYPGDRHRRFRMHDWIAKHALPIDLLLMREGGDTRRDSIVKLEILDRDIAPRFDVLFAIDDRPQVIEAWESRGIPVVAVSDPGIDPFILTRTRGGDRT